MLANRSMPPCTVIPELVYDDVGEAVDWLCETFGFEERWRAGNSVMVHVADADSHYEQARGRGALILHAPKDYPCGERQYTTEDLAGHRWSFSQSIADVAPEEWGGTSVDLG